LEKGTLGPNSIRDGADAALAESYSIVGSTASAGLGNSFNIMNPYLSINFIIKVL
jgi:hypothetical protein